MADAVQTAGDIAGSFLPKVGSSTTLLFDVITWGIIALIIGTLVGIVTWIIMRNLKFNKKLEIYEKIGGKWVRTKKDRGMEVKLSTAGDTITYLRRYKKYLPNPKLQVAPKTFMIGIRGDDEWINFELGDLDEESKKVGAKFLDKEMRYSRTQIQRGLKERYDQQGFWAKYGTVIVSIVFIVVIGMLAWLLFREWVGLANATTSAIETAGEVIDKANQVLSSLDNICTGGSGLVPQ